MADDARMRPVDYIIETERLLASEWHSIPTQSWEQQDLERVVAHILTERVTRPLPEPWHGVYTLERARSWIADRDDEGTTLLIIEKSSRRAVGLLLLAQCPVKDGVEIRIGYMLAEPFWARGFASELIAGLVASCRQRPSVLSMAGGVTSGNPASARVLEKNGFRRSASGDDAADGETIWRLSLRT